MNLRRNEEEAKDVSDEVAIHCVVFCGFYYFQLTLWNKVRNSAKEKKIHPGWIKVVP